MIDDGQANNAGAIKDRIERCFRDIETKRMAGIPILNPAVRVEVVGLERFANEWLCILVTPWFMNIMLLPVTGVALADNTSKPTAATGTKSVVAFPAGNFEVIAGFEHGIGHYRVCSLFSPMHEFTDHDSAILAAQAALATLLQVDATQDVDLDMEAIWRGERGVEQEREHAPEAGDVPARSIEPAQVAATDARTAHVGLDRRSLLFGRTAKDRGA
ncbi:MAG TPA: [NiFe]-hydrogenase assembly chaperone HybE [Hyphomicrobiaceae bacterium]|nr:[NiFe]-hydrogenase assembly chaperone HybE [Hyphomicrobiaceae bacterium]